MLLTQTRAEPKHTRPPTRANVRRRVRMDENGKAEHKVNPKAKNTANPKANLVNARDRAPTPTPKMHGSAKNTNA